jgi:alpha-tubulin suppressor-like RCC1 family protein
MPNANTNFREGTLDLSKILVSKEFLIESFPQLLNQNKIPTLWLWGSNLQGNAGNNERNNYKSSPVQTISGGTNWRQVSGGGAFFCSATHFAAIKTDGTLWLWGDGDSGVLGDNSTTTRSSPVQTVSTGTNWKQVSAGGTNISAIKTDGTLWLWGNGQLGRLGNNSTINQLVIEEEKEQQANNLNLAFEIGSIRLLEVSKNIEKYSALLSDTKLKLSLEKPRLEFDYESISLKYPSDIENHLRFLENGIIILIILTDY